MARKHHKPEEIIAKLRQVEVLVGQGKPVAEGDRGDEGDVLPLARRVWRGECQKPGAACLPVLG